MTVTNTATESNIHSTLGYALVNPPAGMGIDANGVITWTPQQNQSPATAWSRPSSPTPIHTTWSTRI